MIKVPGNTKDEAVNTERELERQPRGFVNWQKCNGQSRVRASHVWKNTAKDGVP